MSNGVQYLLTTGYQQKEVINECLRLDEWEQVPAKCLCVKNIYTLFIGY